MTHESNCQTLRNQFPSAVKMLECVNEEALEDIHPDEVSLFLDQCLSNPERMQNATEGFFEREAREGWEMGR
jgi:hypothetical protein